ncbi:MAG: protein-(glutamine-N5) methyltransferase, release factor-specific [Proteobacteria bacterium]|nr:MAG: protein-(glutamine-N5) methyltransferase, release factor-specific [Pseudomonadota bacterium]
MSEGWTVLRVLEWTAERFAKEGFPSARLDAEVLLAETLGVERIRLYVDYAKPLAQAELDAYRALVRRRLRAEPVAYLVGRREFWSLELTVAPGVLVPRPETELLVDLGAGWIARHDELPRPRVIDVGTGSGAVALALQVECPQAEVLAIELDGAAATIARENIRRGGDQVRLLRGDLLSAVATESVDLVLSNPPYITSAEFHELPKDVRAFEPLRALDGGDDGLDVIRRLVAQARRCLRPDGGLLFEIGYRQGEAAAALCEDAGLEQVSVYKDLAGLDRVVSATRR